MLLDVAWLAAFVGTLFAIALDRWHGRPASTANFTMLFSFVLPIFPTGGWNTPKDWVLPTVTLALAPMGIIARFTRSSMVEVFSRDYMRTALEGLDIA